MYDPTFDLDLEKRRTDRVVADRLRRADKRRPRSDARHSALPAESKRDAERQDGILVLAVWGGLGTGLVIIALAVGLWWHPPFGARTPDARTVARVQAERDKLQKTVIVLEKAVGQVADVAGTRSREYQEWRVRARQARQELIDFDAAVERRWGVSADRLHLLLLH